jgi:hypothetical protein
LAFVTHPLKNDDRWITNHWDYTPMDKKLLRNGKKRLLTNFILSLFSVSQFVYGWLTGDRPVVGELVLKLNSCKRFV